LSGAVGHALRSLRWGGALVGALFDRLPGAGRVTRGLERVPLARAEAWLSDVVVEGTGAGWLGRRVQGWLLGAVRRYTLARFREEGAREGGIDLGKVREELERTVDDRLADKVQAGARLWTALVAVGLVAAAALETWLVHALLTRG
jgi:hypothetical protein